VGRDRAHEVVAIFSARGESCAEIGEVTAEPTITITP
jgi:hypothetical protein